MASIQEALSTRKLGVCSRASQKLLLALLKIGKCGHRASAYGWAGCSLYKGTSERFGIQAVPRGTRLYPPREAASFATSHRDQDPGEPPRNLGQQIKEMPVFDSQHSWQ